MKNILKFVLIFLLTAGAFIAGTAWKINNPDTTNQQALPATESAQKMPPAPVTTLVEEKPAPTRNNLPANRLTELERATIALFEKATPSVVFITTSDVYRDYYTRNLYEQKSGSGSGFIWDFDGHIITNYHVIRGADRVLVTLSDQSTYPAKVIGKAPTKDLAVLKVDAPRNVLHPVRPGRSYDLKVGQSVYAIGNPFGLDQTLTTGVVSALGREINSVAGIPIKDVIQTDAAINPGNSGGPLLNSSGELIGVNTAIYSPSGASAGIGFSIPVDVVKWAVPDLIAYGKLQRPTLGIGMLANRRTEQNLGITGVLVLSVTEGGAAERAGIQPTYRDQNGRLQLGDIIVGIEGEKIESRTDLILALEKYSVGDEIRVTVERNEQRITLDLTLDPALE